MLGKKLKLLDKVSYFYVLLFPNDNLCLFNSSIYFIKYDECLEITVLKCSNNMSPE